MVVPVLDTCMSATHGGGMNVFRYAHVSPSADFSWLFRRNRVLFLLALYYAVVNVLVKSH